MITERDLQEAIAECQGVRNPNANVAIKLAAFLTIQRELFGKPEQTEPQYSYAAEPVEQVETLIDYQSDTEFSQAINGKKPDDVFAVMDELMSVLQVTNQRLYKAVVYKLNEL